MDGSLRQVRIQHEVQPAAGGVCGKRQISEVLAAGRDAGRRHICIQCLEQKPRLALLNSRSPAGRDGYGAA